MACFDNMPENIASKRELVNSEVVESRQYAVARAPTGLPYPLMTKEDTARAALKMFFDSYGPRSRNRVCKAAGVSESAIRAYLSGESHALDTKTYRSLAKYSKKSVAELMGEQTDLSQNDKIPGNVSDLEGNLTHIGGGASASSTTEGNMTEQDRIDLIDDILTMPLERLGGVKKYVQSIKVAGAARANPPHRGRTTS